jgi:hypothetical protein
MGKRQRNVGIQNAAITLTPASEKVFEIYFPEYTPLFQPSHFLLSRITKVLSSQIENP